MELAKNADKNYFSKILFQNFYLLIKKFFLYFIYWQFLFFFFIPFPSNTLHPHFVNNEIPI